jgi:hypothetical protein
MTSYISPVRQDPQVMSMVKDILGNKQASKCEAHLFVCLQNLKESAWLALAWLVKIGVAACLLEARLIGVYAYTEVLHGVEFIILCTDTV